MKKQLMVFFGLAFSFLLFPEIVHADNCSFFADCFDTAKAAAAAATALGIIAAVVSAAADMTEGVGEIKAGIQVVTGYDPITLNRVSRWESAIGLIPVVGRAAAVERAAARGLLYAARAARAREAMQTARGLRTSAKGVSKGIDVYETIREPYDKVKTIRDTAKDVVGKIQDLMGSLNSDQSQHSGAVTRGAETTGDRVVPYDRFSEVLAKSLHSIPEGASASIADETLISLAKTFSKNGEVLKHIVKAKNTIGDLPKDATMRDVVNKLKG